MSHILNALTWIEKAEEEIKLDRMTRDLEIADRYIKIAEIQSKEKIVDDFCDAINNLADKIRFAGRGY